LFHTRKVRRISARSFSFDEPEEAGYFLHEKIRSRLITTEASHQFICEFGGPNQAFLLLEFNGRERPVYPTDNRIALELNLEPGVNLLAISSPGNGSLLDYEITRIVPSVPVLIVPQPEGIEPIKFSRGKQQYEVPTPQIRIEGKRGYPAGQGLRVRDQFNNPLVVQEDGEKFFVEYTLRESNNRLQFQSYFENRMYNEFYIDINLTDFIELELDSNPNAPGFVIPDPQRLNFVICQAPIYHLAGRIEAMKEGVLDVECNGVKTEVAIENYRFTTAIELVPDELNIGRVSVDINGQKFGESFRVLQRMPGVTINRVSGIILDGSIFTHGQNRFLEGSNTVSVDSPLIRILGNTLFEGYIASRLQNTTTSRTVELSPNQSEFEVIMPLETGQNQLVFEMGDTANPIPVRTIDVVVAPIFRDISVNGFNVAPNAPIPATESGWMLSGDTPSIKRGMIKISQDANEGMIPVVDGRFESNSPFFPDPSGGPVRLSVKFGSRVFTQTLPVNSSPPRAQPSDEGPVEGPTDSSG
jgi:hypothetical protein